MARLTGKIAGALLADDFRPDPSQRRVEPRFARERKISILPCIADLPWSFRAAQLENCSAHGLALLVDQPMDAGEQFLVKLQLDHLVLAVYTVRHCRQAGDRLYRIGAEISGFVGAPPRYDPDSVLRALLHPSQDLSEDRDGD